MTCVRTAWNLTCVHGLLCNEYDDQRQFSCCEAIIILQIEEGMGMGKKNVTDGSE